MYERGEAGPRPNPKLKGVDLHKVKGKGEDCIDRIDVGYVNGIPYGLCEFSDDMNHMSIQALSTDKKAVRRF